MVQQIQSIVVLVEDILHLILDRIASCARTIILYARWSTSTKCLPTSLNTTWDTAIAPFISATLQSTLYYVVVDRFREMRVLVAIGLL